MTLALLLLAVAAPAQASPAPAQALPSKGKTASARMIDCKTGDGESRSATFLGRMRSTSGADSMAMRFTLLEQFGDEKLHPVPFPELRAWRQSKPGVHEFRYRQTVTALQGGGQYRMRIDFRWLDADGNLLRKAYRISAPCVQPGVLPNLKVGAPSALPGPGGTAVYIVPVHNQGGVSASDVGVELFVDGAVTDVGHIDTIPAGQTREVRFTGPLCKRRLRVVADPRDTVKEALESDNTLNVGCPALRR